MGHAHPIVQGAPMPEWLIMPTEEQLVNAFLKAIPTYVAGLIVICICLREVRRSRIKCAEHKAELKRRLAEAVNSAEYHASLILRFDLAEKEVLTDVLEAINQCQQLIAALSQKEQSLGGLGMTLTEINTERGKIRLKLKPLERGGSVERVSDIAATLNDGEWPPPKGVTEIFGLLV
jgi:hypothetical protein